MQEEEEEKGWDWNMSEQGPAYYIADSVKEPDFVITESVSVIKGEQFEIQNSYSSFLHFPLSGAWKPANCLLLVSELSSPQWIEEIVEPIEIKTYIKLGPGNYCK